MASISGGGGGGGPSGPVIAVNVVVTPVGSLTQTNDQAALQAIALRLDALEYVAPIVSGFSNNIGTVEIGSMVTTVNLSWTINKTVISQTLAPPGPGSIAPSLRMYNVAGLSLVNDTSFAITVGDSSHTSSASTSVLFRNKRHWGTSAIAIPTSGTIATLASEFATSRIQTRSMSPNSEYLYFAWPSTFGTPSFAVNGLPVTGWVKTTINYLNSSGHTKLYDIWRSQYQITGTFSVVVS